MGFVNGHADIQCRKHGEDECLDVSHQTFQYADEHTEDHRDYRYSSTHTHGDSVADDEDNDHEAKDDDVSSRHVGKESDHKYDGFRENTDQFNHRHEGEDLEPCGDARRVEDIDPIVLVAAEVGDEEGDDARVAVTARLPVTLAPAGKNGIRPMQLVKKMKKNSVSM